METDYCKRVLLDLNHHYVTDIYFFGLPKKVLVEIGLEIKRLFVHLWHTFRDTLLEMMR